MSKEKTVQARIGMVNYINTAPINEIWKTRPHPPGWQLIEAIPSALNVLLSAGEIDLGFVSCYEYCARPDDYRILGELSISAQGPVGSVFLFSHDPAEALDGQQVMLTRHSDTSVYLMKIILEEFYKVTPLYTTGDVDKKLSDEWRGVLAIGDDALRLVNSGYYAYQYDLGEIWNKNTGLPFVFAVCAVREEFVQRHPEVVADIQREFIRCRDIGLATLKDVCVAVAPRIPMAVADCYAYLQAIEHDLGQGKRRALETFFGYLIKRGEASSHSLPLKIVEKC